MHFFIETETQLRTVLLLQHMSTLAESQFQELYTQLKPDLTAQSITALTRAMNSRSTSADPFLIEAASTGCPACGLQLPTVLESRFTSSMLIACPACHVLLCRPLAVS